MALPRIAAHPLRDYAQIETSARRLIILPVSDVLPADLPRQAQWRAVLKCKAMKPGELAKTPLA